LKANSASCWFLLYGYNTMHGQQNIKESPLTFMSDDSEEAAIHWFRHHPTEFFEDRICWCVHQWCSCL